jgi:hypothetical protein
MTLRGLYGVERSMTERAKYIIDICYLYVLYHMYGVALYLPRSEQYSHIHTHARARAHTHTHTEDSARRRRSHVKRGYFARRGG